MKTEVVGGKLIKGWSGYKAAQWATDTYRVQISAKTLYYLKSQGKDTPAERRGPKGSFSPEEYRLIGDAIVSYIGIRQVNGEKEANNKSAMAICKNLLSTRKDVKCVKTFWSNTKVAEPSRGQGQRIVSRVSLIRQGSRSDGVGHRIRSTWPGARTPGGCR